MGSQKMGYKPGDPIKTGDINRLLEFQRGIQTNSGQVGGGTTEFHIPATNTQSMADLSYASFSPSTQTVKSHSVLYATANANGKGFTWHQVRPVGVKSQAYYTLGNASYEAVGTQVIDDKTGLPKYQEDGVTPIVANLQNHWMVAVEPMVPGMKYVLRCDPKKITFENQLKDGEPSYWGSGAGLVRMDANHQVEFICIRSEFNPAPPSPQSTSDPLLDTGTRFITKEYPAFSAQENTFVGFDYDISGMVSIGPVVVRYYEQSDVETETTVFFDGQLMWLQPKEYIITNCYQDADGNVYSQSTGRLYKGYVPRINAKVADNISDLAQYQLELENEMASYIGSAPGWNFGENEAHFVNKPAKYDKSTVDTCYAECVYQAVEDTEEEQPSTTARIILPITKPIRPEILPRPNSLTDTFCFSMNRKIPASYYVAKSMGLIEPVNSTPKYQLAYYPCFSNNDIAEQIKELQNSNSDDENGDENGNETGDSTEQQINELLEQLDDANDSYVILPVWGIVTKMGGKYQTLMSTLTGDIIVDLDGSIASNVVEWDEVVLVSSTEKDPNTNKNVTVEYCLVNYAYIAPSNTAFPILYGVDGMTEGYAGSPFYMQKVELDTSSPNKDAGIGRSTYARYKSFTDRNDLDNDSNSTAGWIGYRYFSDNPDVTEAVDKETFTLSVPQSFDVGGNNPLFIVKPKNKEEGSGLTLSFSKHDNKTKTNDKNDNDDDNDDDDGNEDDSGDISIDPLRFIPIAYSYSGSKRSSKDYVKSFGDTSSYSSLHDYYEKVFGKFSVTSIETVNDSVVVKISFTPAKNSSRGKTYSDLFSFPFMGKFPPRSPIAITTKTHKAHREDWIPALCPTLDENEVLVPGMLVSYQPAKVGLMNGTYDGGEFKYAIVDAPEDYSTVTEGTTRYTISRITCAMPTSSEIEDGKIAYDDVWISSISEVSKLPDYNIKNEDYYVGIKLTDGGYPDMREPFGAFRDCDNLANRAMFFRTTPFNVSFPCTCRLDYIPFGYAIPSRTPSCYYKSSNDDCAVNFTSSRYTVVRADGDKNEKHLFVTGACYVPCSSLSSLG